MRSEKRKLEVEHLAAYAKYLDTETKHTHSSSYIWVGGASYYIVKLSQRLERSDFTPRVYESSRERYDIVFGIGSRF